MKTAREIYEELKTALLARTTDFTNFNPGSRIRSLLEAIAVRLEEIQFTISANYRSLFITTATGDALTLRAKELGVERMEGEDDEHLRKRAILAWYKHSGATINGIKAWCFEVEGVEDVHVVPNAFGLGTAKVLIWSRDEDGNLVPASSELIQEVQNILTERAPIGVTLKAVVPDVYPIDVNCEVKPFSASSSVEAAIRNYLNSLSPGQDVILAKLIAIVLDAGAEDVRFIYPRGNVEIPEDSKATAGQIQVSPWGSHSKEALL